jgi:hypothetical protein
MSSSHSSAEQRFILISSDYPDADALERALREELPPTAGISILHRDAASPEYRFIDLATIVAVLVHDAPAFQAITALVTAIVTLVKLRPATIRIRTRDGSVIDIPGSASPDTIAAILRARQEPVEHTQAIEILQQR